MLAGPLRDHVAAGSADAALYGFAALLWLAGVGLVVYRKLRA